MGGRPKQQREQQAQGQDREPVVFRRAETDRTHYCLYHEGQRPFLQLRRLRRIVQGAGEPDHQGRDCDDANGVGSKPVQPSSEDWRFRAVEQDEPGRPTDTGDCSSNRSCQKEAQYASRAIESEPRTEMVFDQPRYEQSVPALHSANTLVLARFRSPNRLAAKVAATTPNATGHRAPGPSATNIPEAIPAAGQNTATPSGVSSARLNCAARK